MATLPNIVATAPLNASNNTYTTFVNDTDGDQIVSALSSTPLDFLTMTDLTVYVEASLRDAPGNDTYTLSVYIANGATILAAADAGGTPVSLSTVSSQTDTTWNYTFNNSGNYINTTANKSVWDGASVYLVQGWSKSQGGDANAIRVDYAYATGNYVQATPAFIVQEGFRFYNNSGTPLAAENADPVEIFANGVYQFRVALSNTGQTSFLSGYQLQYNNTTQATGWQNVTGASSHIRAASAGLTEGAATSDVLASGTGTFSAGTTDNIDGTTSSITIPGNNHTELVFGITVVGANVAEDDNIDFRIVIVSSEASLDSYLSVPSGTVKTIVLASLAVTEGFSDSLNETATVAIAGNFTATEGFSDTLNETATVAIAGTFAVTESFSDSLSETANVSITGSQAVTESFSDSLNETATAIISGSMSITETNGSDTLTSTGFIVFLGSGNITETNGPDTLTATLSNYITGSQSVTESFSDSLNETATAPISGSALIVEDFSDSFYTLAAHISFADLNAIEGYGDIAFGYGRTKAYNYHVNLPPNLSGYFIH
jgi:hypothetical protein